MGNSGILLSYEQEIGCDAGQECAQSEDYLETLVFRLMPEVMHPQQSAQAATEKSEQEQIAFRYAPSFLPRFLFIDAHQNE